MKKSMGEREGTGEENESLVRETAKGERRRQ